MLLACAAAGAAPDPALASGWSIEATPNLAGPPSATLHGASCPSTNACFAVGDDNDTAGVQQPLTAVWNGTAWVLKVTPSLAGGGALNGVACTSSTACTAVGEFVDGSGAQVTLAERWNGTSWSIQSTPDIAGASQGVLNDVSCASASTCMAVGYYRNSSGTGQLLAEMWNGTTWAIEPTATPASGGALLRVSCSAASACTALGQSSGTTLIERWNGTAWSSQTAATPAGATGFELYGLTCTGLNLCTAVGHWAEVHQQCIYIEPVCNCLKYPCRITNKQSTLVEQWSGSAWTVESTPGTGILDGVSCPTATDCSAVGFGNDATVAEQWNGSTWSAQTIPNPAFDSGLQQVSCAAAASCVAVGNGSDVTLAEGWNGTGWSIQPTPNPPGPANPQLAGVACASSSSCTAVGQSTNGAGTQVTLSEDWNGTSWQPQTTISPSGAVASWLSSVSCPATAACTAVGAESTGGGNPALDLALAEAWNGTTWSIEPTPSLGAGYESVLSGVSCKGQSCMAVGYDYYNQGPNDAPLGELWNGSAWTLQSLPVPAGAITSALTSVSCPTTTDCTAVGYEGLSDPLAEHWNGSAWAIQTTPGTASLFSVSCPAIDVCMAVGGNGSMAAEEWNGSNWTLQSLPVPAGANGGSLSSVSCPSTSDCLAVGNYTDSSGASMSLAEQWNGTSWSILPADPAGSNLDGVSCATTTDCTAVGNYGLAEGYSG